MRRSILLLAAAGVLLAGLAARAAAQAPSGAAADSTLAGVYTSAQAVRGEETYMSICVSCHSAGTYVGPEFLAKWADRPLSDLFDLLIEQMPKDDPGGLQPGEYAQVIAYLLRQNKLPAGKSELPADSAALRKIKFAAPKAAGEPEGTRRWRE
jgi:hypothetical protein